MQSDANDAVVIGVLAADDAKISRLGWSMKEGGHRVDDDLEKFRHHRLLLSYREYMR